MLILGRTLMLTVIKKFIMFSRVFAIHYIPFPQTKKKHPKITVAYRHTFFFLFPHS